MSDSKTREIVLRDLQEKQEALIILDKAVPLLEKGWVKGPGVLGEVCALQALNVASGYANNDDQHDTLVEALIASEIGRVTDGMFIDIMDWNDHPDRTKADVLLVFRNVAVRLRAQLPADMLPPPPRGHVVRLLARLREAWSRLS